MKSGTASVLLARHPEGRRFDYLNSLKHSLKPTVHAVKIREYSYPSPPMSNPSSPPQTPIHTPVSLATDPSPCSTDIAPSISPMPSLAISLPTATPAFTFPHPGHAPVLPPFPTTERQYLFPANFRVQQAPGSQLGLTRSIDDGPSTSQGARKSKAHVASACVNCKRAHLSCDVNRPCGRCVATGKQDTCYDVQHKKRGRPRLREENRPKIERMLPEARSASSIPSEARESSTRRIAATRTRRAGSFRSIGTKTSDSSVGSASISPTYPYAPYSALTQSKFNYQQTSAPYGGGLDRETPTAYLDLDLVVLKANQSFRRIMLGSQEVVGRHLSEMIAPADGESFHNIQTRLRMERDERDPYYMPPIVQHGQDPVQGAAVVDVDRFTQGFNDQTLTWSTTAPGAVPQTLTARVRLAKAGAYFVAVTLHNVSPAEYASTYSAQPRLLQTSFPPGREVQNQEPRHPFEQPPSQPMNSSAYPSLHSLALSAPPPTMSHSSSSWSYQQPPQPYTPYQHHSFPSYRPASAGPSRLTFSDPSPSYHQGSNAITSRELPPPVVTATVTYPLSAASTLSANAKNSLTTGTPRDYSMTEASSSRHSLSSDISAGADPSPKSVEPRAQSPQKRRRLDIGDVLS